MNSSSTLGSQVPFHSKKKLENTKITGIVNTPDSQVFIKPSGERYANVDLALALAIQQNLGDKNKADVNWVVSYDAACQYSVNVMERLEADIFLS
ncbi:hypothetical protein DFH09DRAFT_1345671 [Mycena vulgaris]|nr:hypothetical protein DFH09DRAFT_1345671 [Mycena vulgaris]